MKVEMSKKLRFSPIILLFIMHSAFAPGVEACECAVPRSGLHPCKAYWEASAVFSGRVNEISIISRRLNNGLSVPQLKLVRLTILEAFRGVEGNSVEVMTGMGDGDCGIDFKKDENYFVYAYRDPHTSKLNTGICRPTRPLSNAMSDLVYARAIVRGEPGGIIFGIVLRATRPSYPEYGNLRGMEGISVSIEGNDRRYNIKTDNLGKFQLNALPAGTYKVKAELPENIRPLPSQKVKVDERKCAAAEFIAKFQ